MLSLWAPAVPPLRVDQPGSFCKSRSPADTFVRWLLPGCSRRAKAGRVPWGKLRVEERLAPGLYIEHGPGIYKDPSPEGAGLHFHRAGSFPSLSSPVCRGSSQGFHMKSRAGYIENGENRQDRDRNPVEEAQFHMDGSKIYIERGPQRAGRSSVHMAGRSGHMEPPLSPAARASVHIENPASYMNGGHPGSSGSSPSAPLTGIFRLPTLLAVIDGEC
jgi:hypothetical protein